MFSNQTLLPEGYTARPVCMADLANCVEMFNLAFKHLKGVEGMFTIEDIGREWQMPGFNLETDTQLLNSPMGDIAGYYEVWDILNPSVRVSIWGQTHPDHCGLGVGTYLLKWAESRAAWAVDKAPDSARVVLHADIPSIHHAAAKLYQDNAYQSIRHSLRMVIDLDGDIPYPLWPEGIRVRSMQLGQDEVGVVEAVRKSFKDHWGFVEVPFEEEFGRWVHFIEKSDEFDPSLWFLAVDGEQIAGISLCRDHNYEDHDMGWVATLGVRREWRRRGVALALLHHSFRELHRRGKTRVGLGVDAQNLTGATRLYQKAGMHSNPERQYDLYEKELRPGNELRTQSSEH